MQTATQTEPAAVVDFCAALHDIADRLSLPGRRGAKAGVSVPVVVAGIGGEKTPWPASSPEALRALLDELPNDQGHFDSREDFANIMHALKGASVAGGFEAEGKRMALEWADRWSGSTDAGHNEALWESIRNPHVGYGYAMRTLERVNPAGADRVKAVAAQAAFAQAAAQTRQVLSAAQIAPVASFQPAQIPPRRWLYGRVVIAGFMSGLVAPGGTGKSALAMLRAAAMAAGLELLSGEKPIRPLSVWYHNAEDDEDEQLRRLAAVLDRYGLAHASLGRRLTLTSGRDLHLALARMGKEGPEAVPGVVDWIVDTIKGIGADVWMIDPLGAMHSLPENSNEAMNFLAGVLREIIARTGVAIVIVHHAGKAAARDMDAAGAGAARGASAFTDFLRVQEQLVCMTSQEAPRMGVADSERRSFIRVENGKANLSRFGEASWMRLNSVKLNNGDATYPDGDEVVVVERWTPPTTQPGSASDLARVQAAIGAAASPPRLDLRSPEWVGWLIAQTLGLDASAHGIPAKGRTPGQAANYARVRGMLEGWLRDGGLLRHGGRDDESRKIVQFVGIGTPAVLADPDVPEGSV